MDTPQKKEPVQPPAMRELRRAGLAMVPFTPVPFAGQGALYAWIRLGIYGAIAWAAWPKVKPVSYIAGSAMLISVGTSVTSMLWSKSQWPQSSTSTLHQQE